MNGMIMVHKSSTRKILPKQILKKIVKEIKAIEKISEKKITVNMETIDNFMNVKESKHIFLLYESLWGQNNTLASFKLVQMPGFCGTVVLTELRIDNQSWENKGIGTILNKIAIIVAREFGYGRMILHTLKPAHEESSRNYYISILEKDNFTKLRTIRNPRSTNIVYEYSKDLVEI